MPVACGEATVLTGSDGAIYFTPPATSFCLADYTDFSAGTSITVPQGHDYRVGDPIAFTLEGAASLDTALTVGTTYYVVAKTTTTIDVSAANGGTVITLNGDGGSGTADTPGAHINIAFAEAEAVCQVSSVNLSFTRGEIDTTSLPCGIKASTTGVKLAGFRTYQPGYAEGSGDMTVRFTADNTAFANRMIQGALFSNQGGAVLKVYLNAVADSSGLKPDDAASLLAEFPVSLLGFSFGVTPEDTPTEAQISFRLSAPPTKLLGLN